MEINQLELRVIIEHTINLLEGSEQFEQLRNTWIDVLNCAVVIE